MLTTTQANIGLRISASGLAVTKMAEGCRLTAYQDGNGVWTVGVGHTGKDVHQGLVITEIEAIGLLEQDMAWAETAVKRLVTCSLTQGQFDCLCDFVFNVGSGHFAQSTLLKEVNAGCNDDSFAHALYEWVEVAGKKSDGLIRRRDAEFKLWQS